MSRVNPVYLNVETIPPVGTKAGPEHVHIPGSVTKTETIAAYKADPEKQLKGWGDQAKDPFKAQVFVITVLGDSDDQPFIIMSMNERELFVAFEEWVAARKASTRTGIEWLTFNGLTFDYLLIRMRAIKYRLTKLARDFTVATRWGDGTHKDIYRALGEEGKLDVWAEFFGIHNENHKGFNGGDIPAALAAGQWDKLNAHFRSRVTIIRELNNLMGYI